MFTKDEARKLAQKVMGFSTFPDCQVTVTATSVADPPAQASMTITVKAISVVVTAQASTVQFGKMVPNIVAVVNDDRLVEPFGQQSTERRLAATRHADEK